MQHVGKKETFFVNINTLYTTEKRYVYNMCNKYVLV